MMYMVLKLSTINISILILWIIVVTILSNMNSLINNELLTTTLPTLLTLTIAIFLNIRVKQTSRFSSFSKALLLEWKVTGLTIIYLILLLVVLWLLARMFYDRLAFLLLVLIIWGPLIYLLPLFILNIVSDLFLINKRAGSS